MADMVPELSERPGPMRRDVRSFSIEVMYESLVSVKPLLCAKHFHLCHFISSEHSIMTAVLLGFVRDDAQSS